MLAKGSFCRTLYLLAGLLAFAVSPANATTKWQKFCLDIYIIVEKPKGENQYTPGAISYWDKKQGRWVGEFFPVPAKAFNKNGVASIPAKSTAKWAKPYQQALRDLFRDINKVTKDCKVWFERATIHLIDPTKAIIKGKKGKKGRPLSDWMKPSSDDNDAGAVLDKKVDGLSFLAASRELAKQMSAKSKCLTMVLVNVLPSSKGDIEKGRAATPGNHSVVSFGHAFGKRDGGTTAAHEILHNLGMAHSHEFDTGKKRKGINGNYHNTDKVVDPDKDGKVDVLSAGQTEDGPTNTGYKGKLKPYLKDKDCKTLCRYVEHRAKLKDSYLVKPEAKEPPKDYLKAPEPPKVEVRKTSEKACKPKDESKGKDGKPKVAIGKLPLPKPGMSKKELAGITEAWKGRKPEEPKDCCGVTSIKKRMDELREMKKRISAHKDAIYEKIKEFYKDTSRDLTKDPDFKRLKKARDAASKILSDLDRTLRRFEKMRKAAFKEGKDEKCDHAMFLPGSPLFPLEPKKTEYAVKFAYSEPVMCVATTHYFGETVYRTEAVPEIRLGEPRITKLIEEQLEESGWVEECETISITGGPTVTEGSEGKPEMEPGILVTEETEIVTVTPEGGQTPQPGKTPGPEQADQPEEPTGDEPEEGTPEDGGEEVPPKEEEEPEETIDLGLVKADETVVLLALKGEETGTALSEAKVKFLDDEPTLPDEDMPREDSDIDLANYLEDLAAEELTEDGEIAVALEDVLEEAADEGSGQAEPELTSTIVALAEGPNGSKIDPDGRNIVKQEVRIKQTRREQFVLIGNPVEEPQNAVQPLPVGLGGYQGEVCISRSFAIGSQSVYVVEVPHEMAVSFKESVTTTGDYYVEPDPCRDKEQVETTDDDEQAGDPLYEAAGLWGQDFDNQWAIKQIGYQESETEGRSPLSSIGEPVTVAVIDTGLDWNHPDFSPDNLWRNPLEIPGNFIDDDDNGYIDDVIGWNFIDNNKLPWDYDGHGTFVAGIIAADNDNGQGIRGINGSARIMVLKALDAFGRGHASHVAQAISYAADNGAKIINLSLGGQTVTRIEQLAIDHARSKGALVVVAAGNAGRDVRNVSPAGLNGVLTVSATDRRDKRAGFSNWGPAVDIAAPGVDILSLRARKTDLLSLIPGVKYERGSGIVGKDRAYFRASGTSFAAPMVSATLSLLLSGNPDLTLEQAERMVLQSARDIETPGYDNFTGFGLLNAAAALKADPDYFIDARLDGAKAVRVKGKSYLQVTGSIGADALDKGVIQLGKGKEPEKWLQVKKQFTKSVEGGTLVLLPASFFKGAGNWTIRLIVHHTDGSKREARINLTLG